MMAMDGKVVLITGATSGIGKVAAMELAKLDARLVLVGRNAAKTQRVAEEIRAQTHNPTVDYLIADLSSMDEVRALAQAFRGKYDRLDILINNAGALFSSRQETVDGYEMTFGLNHLSYFLLTNLLLDILKASAPARIINVSSEAHQSARIRFDDLQSRSYGMGGLRAYAQSKLANILFTYELARRLEGSGVTVNALHPGLVASGFGHNNGAFLSLVYKVVDLFAVTPEEGAQTIIFLASSPEVEGVTGQYWQKGKPTRSSSVSYDEDTARRLWTISEQMTGLAQPAPA